MERKLRSGEVQFAVGGFTRRPPLQAPGLQDGTSASVTSSVCLFAPTRSLNSYLRVAVNISESGD